MYGRDLGMTPAEEDQSDKRSSTSSVGWMMKNPLRPPPQEAPPVAKLQIDTNPYVGTQSGVHER
jgi:hypothetical protein